MIDWQIEWSELSDWLLYNRAQGPPSFCSPHVIQWPVQIFGTQFFMKTNVNWLYFSNIEYYSTDIFSIKSTLSLNFLHTMLNAWFKFIYIYSGTLFLKFLLFIIPCRYQRETGKNYSQRQSLPNFFISGVPGYTSIKRIESK